MATDFLDEGKIWRRCENAWHSWLDARSDGVFRLGEAEGNAEGTSAPLITVRGERLRAPDFESKFEGQSIYWEVKYRSRSNVDRRTGTHEHWMDLDCFKDYLKVHRALKLPLYVVLYEGATPQSPGRWLRAGIEDLAAVGREGQCYGAGGQLVDAFIWPVSAMRVVDGPPVQEFGDTPQLLPEEGPPRHLSLDDLIPIERSLRESGGVQPPAPHPDRGDESLIELLLRERLTALEVLSRSLGMPLAPSYSVLRVGTQGISSRDLFGLLRYGIRLFLISEGGIETGLTDDELAAYTSSRLLEWAVIDGTHLTPGWVVDGALPDPEPEALTEALAAADATGLMNVRQYRIVHAAQRADVLVTAGAGTGKTETMSERIVFLLTTTRTTAADLLTAGAGELRLDQVVLVTFTREAAREMSDRIGRTIALRQRLCPLVVHPILPWLMQLGSTRIATIHAFARSIVKQEGGHLGIGPAFRVSSETLAFRSLVYERLSPHLEYLYTLGEDDRIPPAHQWQRLIESLWATLSSNGIRTFALDGVPTLDQQVDLGWPAGEGLEGAIPRAVKEVLEGITRDFTEHCRNQNVLPVGALVSVAHEALRGTSESQSDTIRYLFVDEFQDTDEEQMELILEVRDRLHAPLFVVGDEKQGVYRFRGASGDAFVQLANMMETRQLPPLTEFPLTRNFRSDGALLDSMHDFFLAWGNHGLLSYRDRDRLEPRTDLAGAGIGLEIVRLGKVRPEESAAQIIEQWQDEKGPNSNEKIAILCRSNGQAMQIRNAVHAKGRQCDLILGGSFFRSSVAMEMRVLLQAVLAPDDPASVLELLESRWAAGLWAFDSTSSTQDFESGLHEGRSGILNYRDRFETLTATGSVRQDDLAVVSRKLAGLGSLKNRMSAMSFVVEATRLLQPDKCSLPGPDDETARRRYALGLDHLITLMDAQFQESSVTLERVLAWLRLQIATNRTSDEPNVILSQTTALTVHKAKGQQFDRVLIPHTSDPFVKSWTEVDATVLAGSSGHARLLWSWKVAGRRYGNVAQSDAAIRREDAAATCREETRLLYVAMTRAKHRLVVLSRNHSAKSSPQSWADLLDLGGAS
jgi:DNA helicase-2/ATP-dependent DNA helicase PcrA